MTTNNRKKNAEITKDIVSSGINYSFMMIDRMEQDCKYFLGYGNGNKKYLWGCNVEDHIKIMREIYESIPKTERPEWINKKRIKDYEYKMKKILKEKRKLIAE